MCFNNAFCRQSPTAELEHLIKQHFPKLEYFHGSVMKSKHLARVNVEHAEAVIILANRYANNPDTEDGGNILRVISFKNYFGKCRIIVQLLSYHNKRFLLNISNWDPLQDEAVCVNELKLGFLAQSAIAPGVSTLLSNFFQMVSHKKNVSFILILMGYQINSHFAGIAKKIHRSQQG